jgi:ABC-type xylose transport system, periplasmic component
MTTTAITRLLVAATVLAIATGTLTACTNGVGNGPSTRHSVNPATARIGLLLPDSNTARYAAADRPYFDARIAELCPGCTVLYANADADASKQQQQAESMITQGVGVLVLDAEDDEAAATIVSEAKAKNVPVISYDRLINSPDLNYFVSFDNERVGKLQATALVDKLRADHVPAGSGILMVNGSPTDSNAALYKRAAHQVIDSSGYTVLAEYDTPDWDPTNAQNWVAGQITQYGKRITGIYAANDSLAGGAISAWQAAGRSPVPVVGQDAELAGVQRILAATQYMTVYKAIKREAERAAALAVDLLNGRKPRGQTTVTTAGGSVIQAFLLVPVAVTAGTIENTVVKDDFYGPDSASQICTSQYAEACAHNGIK